MDLIFFGIQGSGKGTQAKKLAAEFDYYIFEAGGELRAMVASETELGNTVKSYMEEGHLVPFEIIMEVVKEAILAQPPDQKIIFDGIPRDEDQMKAFDEIMSEVGRKFRCVEIKINKEEAFNRILGRAEKEGRADDSNEEKIRRRMGIFTGETMPVINNYKEQGKVIDVDGVGSIDDVYEALKEALE